MIREERSVSLAVLTLLVYGGMIFLEKGAFILPFPLNEFIFLIVALQFFVWNRATHLTLVLPALVAGIFNVLSTELFWSFFLNYDQLQEFSNSPWGDMLKIGFYLTTGIWLWTYLNKADFKFKLILIILLLSLLITATFFSIMWLELLVYVLVVFFGLFFNIPGPVHLLWILLAILEFIKVLSLSL